MANMKVPIKNW